MATVLAGMVVIATFLVTSVLLFGTFLSTSVSQGKSLKVLTDVSSRRLGSALGADLATFSGLAGVGDLIPRKVASTDRHRELGAALARGEDLDATLAGVMGCVEGVRTAREANQKAERLDLDLPLVSATVALPDGDGAPRTTLDELLHLDLHLGREAVARR